MANSLIEKIREFARTKDQTSYPAAPCELVEQTSQTLGFEIPALLKACYTEIANGGIGPGYGLIGMAGGAESDFGPLVDTYNQLKDDKESEGEEWKDGVLPFCDWGCNIFTCIDCTQDEATIYKFEDFELWRQKYSLEQFFEMWMNGTDILAYDGDGETTVEITNPFTGDQETVSTRK